MHKTLFTSLVFSALLNTQVLAQQEPEIIEPFYGEIPLSSVRGNPDKWSTITLHCGNLRLDAHAKEDNGTIHRIFVGDTLIARIEYSVSSNAGDYFPSGGSHILGIWYLRDGHMIRETFRHNISEGLEMYARYAIARALLNYSGDRRQTMWNCLEGMRYMGEYVTPSE